MKERLRFPFTFYLPSSSASGDIHSSVRYDLALDPGRLISRAIFEETKNWTLTRRKIVGLGEYCETLKLFLSVRTLDSGEGEGEGGRRNTSLFPPE